MKQGFTLTELAQLLGAQLIGNPSFRVHRLASLTSATGDALSFVANEGYAKYLPGCQAGALIINADLAPHFAGNRLVVAKPYLAYARVSALFDPHWRFESVIDPGASVADDVKLGAGVFIGPGAVVASGVSLGDGVMIGPGSVIGAGVVIGDRTRLEARVSVYHSVVIGSDCVIHSGAVLGSDGFGFAPSQDGWQKIHQLGRLVIGNQVEIGANSTLDRGALEDTLIGDGVKIDNLVHIAHNVHIGRDTAIAAQTGVAGSARIGASCTLAGQVGVVGHISLTDGVHIAAKSLVTGSITQAGNYAGGTSVSPTAEWRRNTVRFRHLDDMAKRIKQLEKTLQEVRQQEVRQKDA